MYKLVKAIKKPILEFFFNLRSPVRFFNYWDSTSYKAQWLYRFIMHRKILEKAGIQAINVYSVFGLRFFPWIEFKSRVFSIFFTGENVDNYPAYKDYMIDQVDLALGFEYYNHPKYMRFPLWIMYIIRPEWNDDQIKAYLNLISDTSLDEFKNRYCCLVSSHDRNKIKSEIIQIMSAWGRVDCGGKIYNNTDSLKNEFHNNKAEFIKRYKFNICPENSDVKGYVSEKIFQSFESGCIPVYWGSNNEPEPDIFNHKTIFFFNSTGDNTELTNQVSEIVNNPLGYSNWASQPKFLPQAAQHINQFLDNLENEIILKCKKKYNIA